MDDRSADHVSASSSSPEHNVPTEKAVAAKSVPARAAKESPASKKSSRIDAARDLARSAPASKYFDRSRRRARRMLDDPEALQRVAEQSSRAGAAKGVPFADVMEDFRALVRLVVAYARGNYRDVPPDALALVVAGLVYVISPVDLLPDSIPGVGVMDDAVVVGWVIKSVRDELDAFRTWEAHQKHFGG